MNPVTTAELLTAWERGLSQSGARRLLTLLATAHPDVSDEQLLKLSIGQRDGLALKLRETLFGSQLTSIAACPVCNERLEFSLDVADIKITPSSSVQESLALQLEGIDLEFRLPDSQDLMIIEAGSSVDEARRLLFERCLLSVVKAGKTLPVNKLSETILDKVEAAMSDADPQANVQLDLCCPACQHSWLAVFDIASFLWSEINVWAQRVLNEVHLLAKAYAWREADILAMSPTRRRYYLERVMQ
jgi:uncharacterized protein YbaR (Trm112 family)